MKFYSSLLLLSTAYLAVVLAEDAANDEEAYDEDYTQDNEDSNYFHRFSVCQDSTVVVQDLSVYCDSPGAYYYGSGKYRNSATCQAEDKAKVNMELYISEDLEADPYLTVEVQGYGSVASATLYSKESFCSVATSSDGSECPQAGYYTISEQFYFGEQNDDYTYNFTPKVSVGISSYANSNNYDLGGANTNMCNGGTFSDWTKGVRKSASETLATFFLTFGILAFAILSVCLTSWCVVRKAREYQTKIIVDEELDETQYTAIRDQNNAALVNV